MGKEKELEELKKYAEDGRKIFEGLGPNIKSLYNSPDFFSLCYLNYQLLKHSKRLECLTVALIVLTVVLSVLAALNIYLLL